MRWVLPLVTCLVLLASDASAADFAPVGQPGPPLTVAKAKLRASLKCTGVRGAKREPVLLESATGVTSGSTRQSRVRRIGTDGTLSTIATGLTLPTAMTFDPDGDELYVSNNGFTPGTGAGQIVRIAIE